MKKLLIPAAICAIAACELIDNNPERPAEGNVTEHHTGLIDTEIHEHSGEPADDYADDQVGEDETISCHISGADVTIVPETDDNIEITLEGESSDGQLERGVL